MEFDAMSKTLADNRAHDAPSSKQFLKKWDKVWKSRDDTESKIRTLRSELNTLENSHAFIFEIDIVDTTV